MSRSGVAVAPRRLIITLAIYSLVLLAAALTLPLRIPEVLQIAATRYVSAAGFFGWNAQAPASAPLNPMAQLPFVLLGGHTRLGARLVSIVFAVAACYLFVRLAKRIPLERPYWALLLFMLWPLHFELSFEGRQFEQALFLLVLATELFFRLIARPRVVSALLYAGCLTLCLYTDRYSFLPAIGYQLFLQRFADRAQERRAMWHALPATAIPALLFLPYALWAHNLVNPDWVALISPPTATTVYLRALRGLAPEHWASYLLCVLLLIGLIAGASISFRVSGGAISKRIRLFVLSGGVLGTIILALVLDIWLSEPFTPAQLLWTLPAVVILLSAALEWLGKRSSFRPVAVAATILFLLVCVIADAEYLLFPEGATAREDLQAIAADVPGQLSGDACVVFVSERLSRALFLAFKPQLASHECLTFFHSRIVLASHPYVRPDQQRDAEYYFTGLNMVETKRIRVGGGEIAVMEQRGQ